MLKAFLSIIQQRELPAAPTGARGRPWPEPPRLGPVGLVQVWFHERQAAWPAGGDSTTAWAWPTVLLVPFLPSLTQPCSGPSMLGHVLELSPSLKSQFML